MLVQCPKCKTTYKVAEDAIKGTSPAFRCSRCKHTFELEPTPTTGPAGGTSPANNDDSVKPDERELSFAFGAGEPEQSQPQSRQQPPQSETEESSAPAAAKPEAGAKGENADSSLTGAAEPTDDKSFAATAPQPAEEKIVAESGVAPPARASIGADPPSRETAENIVPINEFRDQAASTVPYLTLFGLLVIFFFLATAYLEAHPNISESVVRKIPVIGPSVLRNSYLKNGVLLKAQRAVYQSIEGNREVLVVTGEAVNQNPVVVREVRILGRLYNPEGKAVEQQVIWLGNALSPKIIRGMSPQDIADLQRLKPLKTFEIPPGDSVSFAIVFLRPAKAIKDFSCEVVSAEGEA
jgi:predicted Zn finger-like uncharacterized protein